jgi:plastocyanin
MLRTRMLVAALVGGLALVVVSAAAAAPKLTGTVGPGFTITLTQNGKKVKTLKAGSYSITVTDKSSIHNFRLKGPGVNKEITSVSFRGTKTITVRLRKGTYTYVCDPHASFMKGSFKVT